MTIERLRIRKRRGAKESAGLQGCRAAGDEMFACFRVRKKKEDREVQAATLRRRFGLGV
jgi:hypothetical protein